MLSLIERAKVFATVRWLWRGDRDVAEAIRGFQATEADGVWHLHRGMARVADPKQKAVLFTHSLEEESHADEFASIYGRYSPTPLQAKHYEREELYTGEGAAWRLVAYVHVGERDATERFKLIADAVGDGPLRDSLGRIVDDESGHVDLTHDMLLRMGATEPEIRGARLRVRLSRAWERWMRAGKRVADHVATLLLSAVYLALGPFAARAARRRLEQRVVEYDNSRLKRL